MKQKPRSRERYILDSLERTFPTGEWVEEREGSVSNSKKTPTPDIGEGISGPENGSGGRTDKCLTVIGGQKYDADALVQYVHTLDSDRWLVLGDGRGAETMLANFWDETLYPPVVIKVNPDLYGKAARKVNVEQVLSFAPTSPLLLVGTGERVKQAKQWLKRARWGREVVELP